nr:MAG TPA: hypothetical protein [Caudoviricetes sp.]
MYLLSVLLLFFSVVYIFFIVGTNSIYYHTCIRCNVNGSIATTYNFLSFW